MCRQDCRQDCQECHSVGSSNLPPMCRQRTQAKARSRSRGKRSNAARIATRMAARLAKSATASSKVPPICRQVCQECNRDGSNKLPPTYSQDSDSNRGSDSAWGARGQRDLSADSNKGLGGGFRYRAIRTQDVTPPHRRKANQEVRERLPSCMLVIKTSSTGPGSPGQTARKQGGLQSDPNYNPP